MNPKVRKITKVVLRLLFWTIVITAICTTYFTGKSVFNQSSQMCTNQTTSLDSAAVYFLAQGFDVKEFEESYLRETIQLTSTLDSHIIPAVLLSADGVTDRNTAILVHGLNGTDILYTQLQSCLWIMVIMSWHTTNAVPEKTQLPTLLTVIGKAEI